MTTIDDDGDYRWSTFNKRRSKPGSSASKPKEPELNDYIQKVLIRKMAEFRNNVDKKAHAVSRLSRLLMEGGMEVSPYWRKYIQKDDRGKARILSVRAMSENQFECIVPLKRPFRIDAFKFFQKPINELPQHRCLVTVNPELTNEEARLVYNEWGKNLIQGLFHPDVVLHWFNKGVLKACKLVADENHDVDLLEPSVGADGTIKIASVVTRFDDKGFDMQKFYLNIYPVLPITKLPVTVKVHAPLPCFGTYINAHKRFRNTVIDAVDEGRDLVFLDPKFDFQDKTLRSRQYLDKSWKLNMNMLEDQAYRIMGEYSKDIQFKTILTVMCILRNNNAGKLDIISNEILVNATFSAFSKMAEKVKTRSGWLLEIFRFILAGLNIKFIPCFFFPRQNMLADISSADIQKASSQLKTIMTAIDRTPKDILKYAGCSENGKPVADNIPTSEGNEKISTKDEENSTDDKGTAAEEFLGGHYETDDDKIAKESQRVLSQVDLKEDEVHEESQDAYGSLSRTSLKSKELETEL